MPKKQTAKNDTRKPAPPAPDATPEQADFEQPKLRKLGQLPKVTTAFGGSFTP